MVPQGNLENLKIRKGTIKSGVDALPRKNHTDPSVIHGVGVDAIHATPLP